jgi:hypothetical protein
MQDVTGGPLAGFAARGCRDILFGFALGEDGRAHPLPKARRDAAPPSCSAIIAATCQSQWERNFRVADHPEGGQTRQYKGVCRY